MIIHISINQINNEFEIKPSETLLQVLRRNGYFGVKFGGCKKGECGACTILLDGVPVNSCSILAAQVDGHSIETIEEIGEHPEKGWKQTIGLDIIQKAFIETGAIQCGYCTPAMVLAAKSLLKKNINPTEYEVRETISGILCRCTGYEKPVQAILRAAAIIRGENVLPISGTNIPTPYDPPSPVSENFDISGANTAGIAVIPRKIISQNQLKFSDSKKWTHIGQPEIKVDSIKLVQGKPAFTADMEMRGMLVAKVLRSPVAHARIKSINTDKAKSLPGVKAVLTWKDIPRVAYTSGGQSDPIPAPTDTFSLDNKVRHVGDRVAFVAAETEEIAEQAIKLIDVEYEILPVILDSSEAMKEGSPIIHDEPEYINFDKSNPQRNIAAEIRIDIGNVKEGFKEADHIFEGEYEVPKVQQAHIEPHVVISYWDENDRLTLISSTQVPFHVRRILSPILNVPLKRIRVIKPRVGGGFGGKQEMILEDVAGHLTIATGRPVIYEYRREEEFTGSRSRHPMKIHLKTGVKSDGTITANEMYCLSDTGAYGCHGLPVTGNTGHKVMALYVGDGKYRENPNIRFYADIVYTNRPPAGAYRGYGVPQGYWALERQMETIARSLKLDPIEFRLKNALRAGELHPFSKAWSEGREPHPEIVHTVGLEECVQQGKAVIGWDQKYNNESWHKSTGKPYLRKGIGLALVMQGTAIPYLDMGGASLKMNDDGSFNLLIGATDLGTGSDTVLGQMVAEVLGIPLDDIIVYSSDTDFTPFDKGAYASSTTYISGGAVTKAAELVAEKIKIRAANMLNEKSQSNNIKPETIKLIDKKAFAPDGNYVTLSEVALNATHHNDQEQIMAVASFNSKSSPPPFGAQFAEVTVDIETGQVIVDKLVMAVDSGVVVNPITASGQVEGGMTQALGYAVCEEMVYDADGKPRETDLVDYHIFRSNEMPELHTLFVETFEPTHPFGVKAVGEIPIDGVAPAVANAILDASGAELFDNPATPERIWIGLNVKKNHNR